MFTGKLYVNEVDILSANVIRFVLCFMVWLTSEWNSVIRVRILYCNKRYLPTRFVVSFSLLISEAFLGQGTDILIVGLLLMSISVFFKIEGPFFLIKLFLNL